MAYKTILTILTSVDDAEAVLPAAMAVASAHDAHLDVLCLGIDRTQTGYYFAGATAIMHQETLAHAQDEAVRIETAARGALEASDLRWGLESLVAQAASVTSIVANRARFSDLVVMPKPYGPDLPADAPALIEAAMFQGNAPVLVLGGDAPVVTTPERVVIAWNESNEALAAVRRALPLLNAAAEVDICIVAPERRPADAADPGAELAAMLTRHGVQVEVCIVPQTTTRVSEAITRHAIDRDAGLLVMGAYGHSRFREAILGGATRNMLEHAPLPVLMAH